MRKFLNDQSGALPVTFYSLLLIAGLVALGTVVSRAPDHIVAQSGLVRIQASAEPCTNQVLGTRFGKKNCIKRDLNITGASIVFLKAKEN